MRQPSSFTRPGSGAILLVVVAAALSVAVVLVHVGRAHEATAPELHSVADRALRASRPEVRAAHLLRAWDTRRAAAWAAVDPVALRGLYRVGSSAGRRDRAMLLAWQRRGLRVEGLHTQVVRLVVLAHRPGCFDLEVVDRLVGGAAVGPGLRHELPRDAPTARRVVLVEEPGGWVVAWVSAVRS